MIELMNLENVEVGDYLIKKVSYASPYGKVINFSPHEVTRVRKNFVDVEHEYIKISGEMRKATFNQRSSNYSRTVEWFVLKGDE